MYSIPFPRICGNCECTRITNTPRVSAVPSRRGHLQSVLRDETLRHRLFRARQATRRASLRAPSRLRDGPAPRPRRDRLHELGAGDRDLSGGSQGGKSAKKSKYAGRAGMARRHPGPVDKGRLLRPTCAKNEGFVIRAADLETGFYTMKSPMRPEETTFHTRVCEIEGRGGHCRPDRRRRLRETPSAWSPFPSRSRQRKTRDRNAPAPINPFYMRVIPLGHLRCLISL